MLPDDNRTMTILQGRGTVQYTPLEQYGGDTGHTDPRSDIYSLAATLYHLLAGRPPIDAKQRFLKPGSLARLREFNPSVSERTERAILHALAMHPDKRPASIAAFREELFHGAPADQTTISPEATPARGSGQLSAWLAELRLPAAVALILLLLAILITAFGPFPL